MHIYPLCYTEVLRAIGRDGLADLLLTKDFAAIEPFAATYTDQK